MIAQAQMQHRGIIGSLGLMAASNDALASLWPNILILDDIIYLDVNNWILYYDWQPNHFRVWLGSLQESFCWNGYFTIDQLMHDHVKPDNLARYLGVESGIAELIGQYAEEDIVCF